MLVDYHTLRSILFEHVEIADIDIPITFQQLDGPNASQLMERNYAKYGLTRIEHGAWVLYVNDVESDGWIVYFDNRSTN